MVGAPAVGNAWRKPMPFYDISLFGLVEMMMLYSAMFAA